MKYIEPIKSFVLICLVLLSLMFTFMIWSYKPNYPLTEDPQIDQIVLGQEKLKKELVKPYRLLTSDGEQLLGTASNTTIDNVMNEFQQFAPSMLQLETTTLSPERLNEMIRMPSRMTLFFQADVPIGVFEEVVSVENKLYRQATFNRIIIDWTAIETTKEIQFYFVSTTNNTIYRTTTLPTDLETFTEVFVSGSKSYLPYTEIVRENLSSLYTTTQPLEAMQYTYYVDEISSDLLKNVLFENPNIVQKAVEGTQEKYSDSMSMLTLDTQSKNMNYVYPAAESSVDISSNRLLLETMNFLNEHGGFTGDYRLAYMNPQAHAVEFQLFLQGYPVFSMNTFTRVSTVWGEDRIFRYRRPAYSLYNDITSEKNIQKLRAGTEIVKHIENYSELELDQIDDIIVGYYLVQSENSRLFTLEPSWFALSGSSWTRLSLDAMGGYTNGLE